jgi:hypothetical protein
MTKMTVDYGRVTAIAVLLEPAMLETTKTKSLALEIALAQQLQYCCASFYHTLPEDS